jgi:hypothetical protein
MLLSLWQGHSYDGYWIWCYPPERGDPMMTEQELNNLIVHRETTQPGIPSIIQEMMRLSRALEQQARDQRQCTPPRQEMASLARKADKHDQGSVRFDL